MPYVVTLLAPREVPVLPVSGYAVMSRKVAATDASVLMTLPLLAKFWRAEFIAAAHPGPAPWAPFLIVPPAWGADEWEELAPLLDEIYFGRLSLAGREVSEFWRERADALQELMLLVRSQHAASLNLYHGPRGLPQRG